MEISELEELDFNKEYITTLDDFLPEDEGWTEEEEADPEDYVYMED